MSSPGADHLGRGGEAQYVSGFAPDREARVTFAGGLGGPIGYGRGPPNRAHGRRIIESNCTTLIIRGRDESSCGSGHSPATVDTELVVSFFPPHQLR